MTTQEIYKEAAMEKSQLLHLLELHWTDTMSLKVLVDSLKKMIVSTVKQKDLESKRLWTKMLFNLKDLLKKMKRQRIPIDSPLGYESFVELLKSEELYMMLYIMKMNIKQMSQLEDVLKMKANVTCSSLPGTPTISMSSTIAHTPKTDAGVQELTHSGDVAGQMEALFGLTESETIGGTISQYISINRNGTTNTLRSESAEDLHLYGKEFINLSTRELYFKFNNSVRLYNAPNGEVSDYYYTLEESLLIMEKVIMYQCWDDKGKFIQFFMDCLIICDKLKSKVNCLFIQSDPNGGKNYIMDSILHCNFHFGLVGNFNRYCSFPLMECIDKRILMWNEPSCEPSAFETLKMLLFGGDSCNVKVNYKSDTVISRTPIIILSNNDLFPRDEAFCSRMIYYKWRTYPMLKDYNKNFTTNILLFT